MGRRAFRKSNKSMQPGLKLHGTHYVEVLLLDPWHCTFLLANFPNPHQDACAQLCPIILKIYAKFSKSPSGRVCTVMSHNLKNIYPRRMLNTMWTLIQTCTLIPTPFTRTCDSRMAHRLRQTSLIFRQVEILLAHRRSKWANSEAGKSFQPFHKSLASLPKNRALPRSSNTSNNNSSSSRPSSRPLQSLSKTSPGWVLTGCNFNEVRTRCKRGANEVQTRSEIRFWETGPLSLLTNSLVATRFRILFRTVRLKSFQRWSRRGNQAKQQLQARARREKRRQRASKGDRGETEGRQRDASLANKYTIATTFIFGSIVGKPKKI